MAIAVNGNVLENETFWGMKNQTALSSRAEISTIYSSRDESFGFSRLRRRRETPMRSEPRAPSLKTTKWRKSSHLLHGAYYSVYLSLGCKEDGGRGGDGGQFLKAPQRLARQMNSFSMAPSTCQKAAVCVTRVRWSTQNRKQNSSRSSAS